MFQTRGYVVAMVISVSAHRYAGRQVCVPTMATSPRRGCTLTRSTEVLLLNRGGVTETVACSASRLSFGEEVVAGGRPTKVLTTHVVERHHWSVGTEHCWAGA